VNVGQERKASANKMVLAVSTKTRTYAPVNTCMLLKLFKAPVTISYY